MTGQELADAIVGILAGVGSIFTESEAIHTIETLPEIQSAFERLCSDPPCTIDQLPGWTVHTDANGEQIATCLGSDFVRRRIDHPNGLKLNQSLHPWPDPPRFQPGDPVDLFFEAGGARWEHHGRTVVAVLPDGWVVYTNPRSERRWIVEPDSVRPHVEGTA